MSYKSGHSVSIDDISGVDYDSELVEDMNNNNAKPFDGVIDNSSVVTPEDIEDDKGTT